jgi:hypothetical protein
VKGVQRVPYPLRRAVCKKQGKSEQLDNFGGDVLLPVNILYTADVGDDPSPTSINVIVILQVSKVSATTDIYFIVIHAFVKRQNALK